MQHRGQLQAPFPRPCQSMSGSHSSPRIVVLQGMLRRGLQLEALREFIIGQGASKNVTYQVGHLCCCCTCVQGDLSALGN